MKRIQARQYTIRSVPPTLDRALRQQAKQERRSLNEVALEALARGLGLNGQQPILDDLKKVIGTWEDDPDFDAVIADHERVETEAWR